MIHDIIIFSANLIFLIILSICLAAVFITTAIEIKKLKIK